MILSFNTLHLLLAIIGVFLLVGPLQAAFFDDSFDAPRNQLHLVREITSTFALLKQLRSALDVSTIQKHISEFDRDAELLAFILAYDRAPLALEERSFPQLGIVIKDELASDSNNSVLLAKKRASFDNGQYYPHLQRNLDDFKEVFSSEALEEINSKPILESLSESEQEEKDELMRELGKFDVASTLNRLREPPNPQKNDNVASLPVPPSPSSSRIPRQPSRGIISFGKNTSAERINVRRTSSGSGNASSFRQLPLEDVTAAPVVMPAFSPRYDSTEPVFPSSPSPREQLKKNHEQKHQATLLNLSSGNSKIFGESRL